MTRPSGREALVYRLALEISDDDVVNVSTPLTVAAAMLARATHAPAATMTWAGAVNPRIADIAPVVAGVETPRGGTASYSHSDMTDWINGNRITLMYVSPAQVDASGNLNMSLVRTPSGEARRLPGAVALPDIAELVGRLVLYKGSSDLRLFVPALAFVSATADLVAGQGRGVVAVHTPDIHLAMSGIGASPSVRAAIDRTAVTSVEQSWGCSLDCPDPLPALPEPPEECLEVLRRVIDPSGMSGGEFAADRLATVALLTMSTVERAV